MMRNDLSRKQFLSLGVLGALGLLEACTLDDSASGPGAGGQGGTSTTSSGGSGGASSTTSGSAGTSGATGGSTTTGGGGSGGSAGAGGSGAGAAGKGGSAGSGVDGGGGTAGSGGSKDAGVDAPKFDAGACTMVVIAAISMNHSPDAGLNGGPHYLRVPAADIVTGVEAVFETESTPNTTPQSHSHSIKLSAADFAALRAGMTITKKSCDGHEHQYALHCGSMAPIPAGTACLKTDFCGAPGNPC
jgi:hypothetical protein